jgi:hypothetical protein
MKKTIALIPLLMMLAGCDERALEFAKQTREILKERARLIDARIAKEQRAYSELAEAHVTAERDLLQQSLNNVRLAKSRSLTDEYLKNGRKPYRWWQDLDENREKEFAARAGMLKSELDQVAVALSNIEQLQVEKAQTTALDAALEALEKKRNLKEELDFLKNFATESKALYDQQVCGQALAKSKDASLSATEKAKWAAFAKDKGCEEAKK